MIVINRKSILFVFFFILLSFGLTYKDVDCGWTGITEAECVAKGCVWLQNFPGPWCQTSDSPYIPSLFDLGFSYMNDDQYEVFKLAIFCFSFLSIICILGNRKPFINIDLLTTAILFILAWVTRYHAIEHPKEVTFDEYYFGHFANAYCNRIYVFDIHPPLAKLTHYFVGSLLGAECTMNFHGENGGFDVYDNLAQYVPYRQVSAFFGTCVVPLGYLVARKFRMSVPVSVMLGALLICDPLLLSETRLVLTDSQLFFYTVLSIYCALNLWDSKDGSWSRTFWTVATAVASGCAFCVKFTALATLGWIGFVTYLAIFSEKKPIGLISCVIAAIISAIVFAIPFYFHIALGKHSGDADWNVDIEHQKLLIGSDYYDRNAVAPYFPIHLAYLIKRMLEQNAASLGDHPYASFWYEWIVGKGALLSYSEHIEDRDWHGHVFIVSSIFICYSILIAFLCFFPIAFTMIRSRLSFRLSARETYFLKVGFLLFLGWIANLLPYALVERTTYSYHYLPGQFYGMLMLCLLFNELPHLFFSLFFKGEKLQQVLHIVRCAFVIIFMIVLFWNYFYYSCFSYGFGLNMLEYSKRKWAVSGK